jgi:2-methylisocitrate lyase-like PEP mutase family enzyme
MVTQADKARTFKALHDRPGCFLIPNPWDAGTAKLLTQLGFEALATTSAGLAFALGKPDGAGKVTRDETITNAHAIVAATDLPVSADLEDGFGSKAEAVAETIKRAAAVGLVGGSIEDSTRSGDDPIYDIGHAVARMVAAAEAARALPFPFMLVGRAENYLHGRPDLADTIRRLQAYQEAGANVLYAPGLKTREEVATVVKSVDRPVNVLMGPGGATVAELAALGVRRVSVGGSLARAAFGAFLRAAKELKERGTFGFTAEATPHGELNAAFD